MMYVRLPCIKRIHKLNPFFSCILFLVALDALLSSGRVLMFGHFYFRMTYFINTGKPLLDRAPNTSLKTYLHRRNVIVVKQLIYNDISSTKVRFVHVEASHDYHRVLKLCLQVVRSKRNEHQISSSQFCYSIHSRSESLPRTRFQTTTGRHRSTFLTTCVLWHRSTL